MCAWELEIQPQTAGDLLLGNLPISLTCTISKPESLFSKPASMNASAMNKESRSCGDAQYVSSFNTPSFVAASLSVAKKQRANSCHEQLCRRTSFVSYTPKKWKSFFPRHEFINTRKRFRKSPISMRYAQQDGQIAWADEEYDVVVVGAGHSGCEAALAASKLGVKTLLVTLNLDKIAWQPCNPAVGGPAKSTLVHEVDALGGWIGRIADRTYLQRRVLNRSKGPAVWALRAQTDKREYSQEMTRVLNERTMGTESLLDIREGMIDDIILGKATKLSASLRTLVPLSEPKP